MLNARSVSRVNSLERSESLLKGHCPIARSLAFRLPTTSQIFPWSRQRRYKRDIVIIEVLYTYQKRTKSPCYVNLTSNTLFFE